MRLFASGANTLIRRPWLKSAFFNPLCAPTLSPSYSTILTPQTSQVSVPVGSNGSILLEIHHPSSPSPSPPILIHLPRGPLALPSPPPVSSLALSANLTLVSIHYRPALHPTPIHDVLAGYDWILTHLVHASPSARARVAVCGELLGGSLAAMLALTECRRGRAGAIAAAVLGSPVVDWTAMYTVPGAGAGALSPDIEGAQSDQRKQRKAAPGRADSWLADPVFPALSTAALLAARDRLFAKPEHYHDPFASPLLFFRTASSDVSAAVDFDAGFRGVPPVRDDAETVGFLRTRRAWRRHPPLGSGLVLPRTRVDVGANVLRDQGVELAEGMGRSVERDGRRWWGAGKGLDVEEGEGRGGVAGRIEVREGAGVGLWDEEDMVGVGRWVVEALRV